VPEGCDDLARDLPEEFATSHVGAEFLKNHPLGAVRTSRCGNFRAVLPNPVWGVSPRSNETEANGYRIMLAPRPGWSSRCLIDFGG
jgi:hypothetical protein